MEKRVKVNWYKLLYSLGDQALIGYFWKWYNSHKVKSKSRAARNVLVHYYSTTIAPKVVDFYLKLNQSRKALSYNYYAV